MNECKNFKDPIYGYIKIPNDIVNIIVNSAEFQRLRYIRQTSYLPVYPSALHNRFTHSLGVYFLGQIACNSLRSSLTEDILKKEDINNVIKFFCLACILHDVGHSPFSHTGEYFFIGEDASSLHNKLIEQVNDTNFKKDIEYCSKNNKIAAPHEVMSAILSLQRYQDFFDNSDQKSFFARCITGYLYTDINSTKNKINNVFISLLNSTAIDVDKLDYLIRDAYLTGFNNISIDYNRLLNSLMIKSDNNGFCLAYNKSALSVLENVVYARDCEKKWIQNHPIILYETFIIQHVIRNVSKKYMDDNGSKLFCVESLLENNEVGKISLLCDDDIIHLAKKDTADICSELFNRSKRKNPIWKSESEYKVVIAGLVGSLRKKALLSQIRILCKFLNEETKTHYINEEALTVCEKILKEIYDYQDINELNRNNMLDRYNIICKWIKLFKEISTEEGIDFDFAIIETNPFTTGFNKEDFKNTKVYFKDMNKCFELFELLNLLSSDDKCENFFYVYYNKNKKELCPQIVGEKIAKLIIG